MYIQFKTVKLAKRCNNKKERIKAWGERRSAIIGRRLDDLRAADTLEDIRRLPGDCHEYRHGKDVHVFTVDLDGGWRFFFKPINDPIPLLADGASVDWSQVTAIQITDIKDPHGKNR